MAQAAWDYFMTRLHPLLKKKLNASHTHTLSLN